MLLLKLKIGLNFGTKDKTKDTIKFVVLCCNPLEFPLKMNNIFIRLLMAVFSSSDSQLSYVLLTTHSSKILASGLIIKLACN